jgi:hypothetical protein
MADERGRREAEIIELGNWCLAVLRARSQLGMGSSTSELESVVSRAIERKRLAELRTVKRDLSEWIRGLSPAHQATIRANTEGLGGDAKRTDEEAVLRRVITRGKIASRDEYETLRTWFEFSQNDAARSQDLQVVDALLTRFGTTIK